VSGQIAAEIGRDPHLVQTILREQMNALLLRSPIDWVRVLRRSKTHARDARPASTSQRREVDQR
jgi:hypothetical protein